ncbi:MAG: prepilin-type N-terminal cleavage/methylation domain-containing protein [Phycisphaerae bacterium]|nr:prepilin-type N-terminal cleavage/methylation domain-containing protein [Phycisphaerae bacterium]
MRRRRAFTLIELLVVIAIIALLLAIMAPGLQKAKDKARDIVCRAHAKGLGRGIVIYLEENDARAFNSNGSNGLNWTDAAGQYLKPGHADWAAAYWAVGYVDYVEDPAACGCPSYKAAALYDLSSQYYKPLAGQSAEAIGKLTGYGLNSFFYTDVRERTATPPGPLRYNRKTSEIKSPSQFIIAQDHPEPKFEGWSQGGEQNDMMYVPAGQTVNLRQYRPSSAGGAGNREAHYGTIFRHSKRSAGLDEPSGMAQRISQINNQPNGRSNTIFLDGSVAPIPEHTSGLVTERQYSGY